MSGRLEVPNPLFHLQSLVIKNLVPEDQRSATCFLVADPHLVVLHFLVANGLRQRAQGGMSHKTVPADSCLRKTVVHDTPMTGRGPKPAYDPGSNTQATAEPGKIAEGETLAQTSNLLERCLPFPCLTDQGLEWKMQSCPSWCPFSAGLYCGVTVGLLRAGGLPLARN